MKTSFKLFDFAGAPVEMSIWFFILFLWFPIPTVASIFISVLIHELAHAWVANKRGWRVFRVKLDLFTGSAAIDTNIPERDSIPVVLAGPLSNLILAISCIPLSIILEETGLSPFLNTLFIINILMFIFNMLPIFPMDGGRILKDFLFLKMPSNRRLAKNIAGYTSLVFSTALLIYSVVTFSVILIIFSLLFVYTALVEVDIIKPQK